MFFWDKHKTITTCYELLSSKVCDKYGLTQMQYDILMFLYNNPQHNTAADIVKITDMIRQRRRVQRKGRAPDDPHGAQGQYQH